MDIQPGGVQDHFPQNLLKFGFGDWKNVCENRRPNPIFPQDPPKIGCVDGENGKKVYEKRGKQVFVLTNWRFIIKVFCIYTRFYIYMCIILYVVVMILSS